MKGASFKDLLNIPPFSVLQIQPWTMVLPNHHFMKTFVSFLYLNLQVLKLEVLLVTAFPLIGSVWFFWLVVSWLFCYCLIYFIATGVHCAHFFHPI